ncbi:MAG: flagellar basal body L-ring protein FlgH [Oligoflexia bacterium]|nr:flagellar basal body L-ring protein FlgH [Oligoflexia bacterium]
MTRWVKHLLLIVGVCAPGCVPNEPGPRVIPALEYSKRIKAQVAAAPAAPITAVAANSSVHSGFASPAAYAEPQKAQLRLVSDALPPDAEAPAVPQILNDQAAADSQEPADPGYKEFRSSDPNIRDYNGPLSLGDPGVTSSLWRESRSGNELFRDDRAWQPMDLITIVVSENSEGKKEADTDVKSSSSLLAGISNFLGLEGDKRLKEGNPNNINLENLVKATSETKFKGEGETTRKDSLKARISAMVVEVLPSGILRIEGERIISVNSEEQIMAISGLVRNRDINSDNEVDSSKIANLRVDYFGRGTVDDVNHGGWMGRLVRKYWPF